MSRPAPPYLAQINVARLRYPPDAPELRAFIAALARINALAERAPGFVWRHSTGDGHLDGHGQLDDPDEGIARLHHLRRYGPTAQAFTLRRRFDPDGRPEPRRGGPVRDHQ